MGIQTCPDNIILVELPAEPLMRDELDAVIRIIREGGNCDVIVDFSKVGIISSLSLSAFLQLHKLLTDCGHQLIFCSVPPMTHKIFDVTCLNANFKFVKDKAAAFSALSAMQPK